MEQYLIDDYSVFEDKYHLTHENQIEEFYKDGAYDLFDCGQGYYQDEAEEICKIQDKFYRVIIKAEIGSSKQDRGDRLYYVDSIRSVAYEEIEKPTQKPRNYFIYKVSVTDHEKEQLEKFMASNTNSYCLMED